MSAPVENQSRRERSWIYLTVCVLLGALLIGALLTFRAAEESQEAEAKAEELVTALDAAGARTPDTVQIVRVLGIDGGATCENPNGALVRAVLHAQLTNGATGPGVRPVIVDSRVFQGQLLIIQVYCPEELEEFRVFVEELRTDPVAGD